MNYTNTYKESLKNIPCHTLQVCKVLHQKKKTNKNSPSLCFRKNHEIHTHLPNSSLFNLNNSYKTHLKLRHPHIQVSESAEVYIKQHRFTPEQRQKIRL